MARKTLFTFTAVAAILLAAASSAMADTVPLSALQVENIVQTNGKPAVNKSAGGGALSVGGKKFDNGLGLQSPAKIILKLQGGSDHFSATVGVDDEVADAGGTAAFSVTADGVQVFPPAPAGRGGGRARRAQARRPAHERRTRAED